MKKKNIQILLVEDELPQQTLLQGMLSSINDFIPDLATVTCLKEATQILREKKFDVILLDLNLPDSHGIDTILSIHKENPYTPTVVITSTEEKELQTLLAKTGVSCYLIKGEFSAHLLVWTIHYALERKKIDMVIEDNMKKFDILFKNSTVAITIADEQERIVSWNHHAEDLLGATHDDLHMQPVSSFFPEEEWNKIHSLNFEKESIPQLLETTMIKKDGTPILVELSFNVLKDPTGEITGSLTIIKDITEGKNALQLLNIKARRADVILNLMQNLTSNQNPEEMLGLIIETAKTLVKSDTASIVLLDQNQQGLTKVAAAKSTDKRADSEYILNPSLDAKTSITGWVIANKEPLLLFGKAEDDQRFKEIHWKDGIKSSTPAFLNLYSTSSTALSIA